ncbi:hypothetical protein [Mycolicibacterium setense]|uniref:hypothetical protein n=1 Tax=Mycolicibacterium setense TaxID=431269 RepID=UPI0003A904A9|nr:hypothetical protein [Mycolicibacterium setense]KHO21128.1 hypothetical protein QQ25_10705 [Mycolicibacterium setense]MCV7111837.1 hypothetical protein [Mycolicibacterium setense]
MSEYGALAKRWVEVTKLVAAGSWDGIRCPQNNDADVLIDKRSWVAEGDASDKRFEYWIHCPKCGAEIFMHGKHDYTPGRNVGTD